MSACLLFVLVLGQSLQTSSGELHLTVMTATGVPIAATAELTSDAARVHETFDIEADGRGTARDLPFGTYALVVRRQGFQTFSGRVEIRTTVPTAYTVTLGPTAVHEDVTVTAADTLIDARQPGAVHRVGAEELNTRLWSLPGRALPDIVNAQPGWLLEANGILHPRGSEYQTQFVVDGLPLTDNRSPAFAPDVDSDTARALTILTSGYPAEYGRKLGGVIEVVTEAPARQGWHGAITAGAGSFDSQSGSALGGYAWKRTSVLGSVGDARTARYLDPPVEANYSNRGTTGQAMLQVERDLDEGDRLRVVVRGGQGRFSVPNEFVQQEAGQRQDRDSRETAALAAYRRLFAAPLVLDVHAMVRDLSARLWSNPESTPIAAWQDRGLRDGYVKAAISARVGRHEIRAGGDALFGRVREQFAYELTDPSRFEPGTLPVLDFSDRARDREQALFVQDELHAGPWSIRAGVRWDRYRFVVHDAAVSPRAAVAWAWPGRSVVLRASYDRTFETPAYENLLLASSPAIDVVGDVIRLPVRPSRGHFWEAGASAAIAGALRGSVSWYERRFEQFADDDLLLNSGVSFPIAFRRARVHGVEVSLDAPPRHGASGSISYAWMRGTGQLPVTGGLLLGDEAALLERSSARFPISQDQRHTIRAQARWQAMSRLDAGAAVSYGSGLPFEFDGDRAQALAEYGPRIVGRVNFAGGRVDPAWSLDLTAGVRLAGTAIRGLRLQADVRNLTNRLNVINFAGLFSGTALAPPRSAAVRLRLDF